MSLSIGIYELFAYTIPGVLYIYVINEFLRIINYPYVDISKVDNLAQLAILAVLAYIAGHIFDSIAQKIWSPLFLREDVPERMLMYVKEKNKGFDIQFTADQVQLLRSAIRRNDKAIVDRFSKHDVLHIMLRNVSFGFLLFCILQFVLFWQSSWSLQYLVVALTSLGISIIAIRRSEVFRERYYLNIFDAALCYGTSMEQILRFPMPEDSSLPKMPLPSASPDSDVE
jgi:hypothetical protein